MGGFQLGFDKLVEMIEERFGRPIGTAVLAAITLGIFVGVAAVLTEGIRRIADGASRAVNHSDVTWGTFVGIILVLLGAYVALGTVHLISQWLIFVRVLPSMKRAQKAGETALELFEKVNALRDDTIEKAEDAIRRLKESQSNNRKSLELLERAMDVINKQKAEHDE